MATEKAPLLSSPMIHTAPLPEESSASRSLFVNDAAEMEAGIQGEDGPATQKWEIVVVYPNVPSNTFSSPADTNKQQKRDALVGQLRNVGLFVSQRESTDSTQTFLLIGASQAKFEEYAELFGLELTLKDEYGGGFSAFSREKRHLFKVKGSGGFFTKTERQRLIMEIIETDNDDGGAELDLPGMEFDGVIEKVYPLHENSAKKKIIDNFCKSRNPFTKLPLDDLRSYFGEEISFYLAWLAFYTKWLGYASIVGIVVSIIGWSFKQSDYWQNATYSVFIGVWATLFLEFWKRERNVRAFQWNMLDYEQEETHRPGFIGEEKIGAYSKGVFIPLRKDEIYGISPPKTVRNFPIETTRTRMAVGLSFVITLCILVGIATFAVLTFRILVEHSKIKNPNYWATGVGGVSNAVIIMILNKVYRYVAVKLNDWENHRTQSTYTDNLLIKIFLFQFVNSYTSLYYIAFFKRNAFLWGEQALRDTCGDDNDDKPDNSYVIGCPNQLYIQLLILLGTNIAVGQAQEVLIPFILAKAKLYWLERQSQRSESDIPKYEREYQLNQFEGTIDEYAEMVIQYGYLTLFASSVPIAPVLAFVNNVVEMRTDTFKWLTSYNKPFYKGADDIGGWYNILQLLGIIAVVTNSLLLIFSFPTLYNVMRGNDASRSLHVLWTVVILEHVIFLVKIMVSVTVPDVPSRIKADLAKQHYIQQQLIKKYERKTIGKTQREEHVYIKKEMDKVENYENAHD
eukprot:Phypoly_transcript_03275.p1 GENE.Phypoly_transcript_03275~~Phypoly_transcript_03275.p1  ORF type:complete len:739 (+),score=105.38 Phypoly_transcript_03275:250-2466(+)